MTKRMLVSFAGLTLGALCVNAVNLSTSLRATTFADNEITTTSATTTFFSLKGDNAVGIGQSFTSTTTGTVDSISFLTARVYAGFDFEVNVYEIFGGDGSTPDAHPTRFRTGNASFANLLQTYTFDSNTVSIGSGGGDDTFTIGLVGLEQFSVATGATYMVSVSTTGVDANNAFLWDYSGTDTYAGGLYGLPDGGVTVTGRDLGLGVNVIPEPSTYAMIAGALALSVVMVRRRNA